MRLVLVSLAALVLGTAAGAVTVINGSFENNPNGSVVFAARASDTFDSSAALSSAVQFAGWTVFRGGVAYIDQQWQASDGNQSITLSSDGAGGIAQRISGFVIGQRYRMSFDVSADPASPKNSARLYYSASGGETTKFDYISNGNTPDDMQYRHVTYDFVASGKTQQIVFFGIDDQFGPVLDNVSISAIPEPATWGLMIAGFAFTGTLVRRRSRMRSMLA